VYCTTSLVPLVELRAPGPKNTAPPLDTVTKTSGLPADGDGVGDTVTEIELDTEAVAVDVVEGETEAPDVSEGAPELEIDALTEAVAVDVVEGETEAAVVSETELDADSEAVDVVEGQLNPVTEVAWLLL